MTRCSWCGWRDCDCPDLSRTARVVRWLDEAAGLTAAIVIVLLPERLTRRIGL